MKVAYRCNDVNEDRMIHELLTALLGTIKNRKCTELKSNMVIDRVLRSTFIGNKDSHDGSIDINFNDMEAFWDDVTEFEKLFSCETCKSILSTRNYNNVDKKISCNKGELQYTWIK